MSTFVLAGECSRRPVVLTFGSGEIEYFSDRPHNYCQWLIKGAKNQVYLQIPFRYILILCIGTIFRFCTSFI